MKAINIIFPHQLFFKSPLLENNNEIYLIEEYLFFKQYRFHKQKIAFHRATMKAYENYLKGLKITVHYIDSDNKLSDIRQFHKEIKSKNINVIHVIEPTDDWLEQRIAEIAKNIELKTYANPQFLNTKESLATFFRPEKKSFFQTTFYKQQRKKLGILLDEKLNPIGGKWTYDSENRRKYPKNKMPPAIHFPERTDFWDEAVEYTSKKFDDNPGSISKNRLYPITHQEASDWFEQFLTYRFYDGTTGIEPIDHTIKQILKTGYCHHIERLMVLGNFMLLCEFDPDEVYRWFMELFIDAYDWVMVPNVYGMCMFADGGTFATKPYISGSNYIKKMSNHLKGEWEDIWDGLFWRFVMKHQDFFRSNPRTSMLAYSFNRMSDEKQNTHIKNAESFIQNKLNVA